MFFLTAVAVCLKQVFALVGYVSNINSFPQPLSPEEEQFYIEKYNQGDAAAKSVLIERNLRLVAHIVKKYSTSGKDSDDMISIGTIGLIKAISNFDSSKGTKLATYAARCIENEILMSMRSDKKTKNEVFLQDPIGTDTEGNEISLIDLLKNEEESIFDEVDLKMQVKKLYQNMQKFLKSRERTVLQLRYGLLNGSTKTQREIAQMLNISRSYVSRIEKKAIKKLHKQFALEMAE